MYLSKLYASFRYRGLGITCGLGIDALTRPVLYRILSKHAFVKVAASLRLGYLVNLSAPRSFNEYILSRKLFRVDPRVSLIADKYAVRKHVADLGLASILNELYVVADQPEGIPFSRLPRSFAMKATHGSGHHMIRIVPDKAGLDLKEARSLCRQWLTTAYNAAVRGTEYHYDHIVPRVLVERLLANDDGSPLLSYEFYCFHGNVEFIGVVENLGGITYNTVYDQTWNKLPFGLYNARSRRDYLRPVMLGEMVKVAEQLSLRWDFLRVDLYLVDGMTIVFGELTYSPGGGMLRFVPRSFDFHYGQKLLLGHETAMQS
jgi:hypothetical protein